MGGTARREPLYEQDFLPCSYGFRPGRFAHQALQELRTGFMRHGLRWVIDLDIEKYLYPASYCPPTHEE
jgi:retron-type reverse transcriptase